MGVCWATCAGAHALGHTFLLVSVPVAACRLHTLHLAWIRPMGSRCLRACRYVPLYMGQLLAPMGSRGACAREWSHSAAAALVAEFWAEAPALLPSLGSKPHWAQLAEREVMLRSGCGGVEEGLPLLCHALADKVCNSGIDSVASQSLLACNKSIES